MFSDSSSLVAFLVALSAAIVGPVLTYMATRRKQQTSEYSDIIEASRKMRMDFQEDYEKVRKRLEDQEVQLQALRQRIMTLEAENQLLRQQLVMAGVQVKPAASLTQAGAQKPPAQAKQPATPSSTRKRRRRAKAATQATTQANSTSGSVDMRPVLLKPSQAQHAQAADGG